VSDTDHYAVIKKLLDSVSSYAYKVLVESLEERVFGKPRHRWEDNNKMVLKEIRWGSMDWIRLAQDMDQWQALVNMGYLHVP
jgi:hypothetical protein